MAFGVIDQVRRLQTCIRHPRQHAPDRENEKLK